MSLIAALIELKTNASPPKTIHSAFTKIPPSVVKIILPLKFFSVLGIISQLEELTKLSLGTAFIPTNAPNSKCPNSCKTVATGKLTASKIT